MQVATLMSNVLEFSPFIAGVLGIKEHTPFIADVLVSASTRHIFIGVGAAGEVK